MLSLWSSKRKRDDEEAGGEGNTRIRDQAPPPKISKTSTAPVEETTPVEETNGLFILHPNEEAVADVVAVHGLGGHAFHTWTEKQSGKLWLRDFLPSQIPSARIMTYGYDSKVAFSKSDTEINDIAADLLARLQGERDTEQSKNRPVIFICHSLGGIIVKKVLIIAHERSTHYGELRDRVKGVVFMGTPHRGSGVAYWADLAASLLGALQLQTSTNGNFVSALKRNSDTLRQITEQFVERSAPLEIRTFYETVKLDYMNNLVVEKESAFLGLPNERLPIPINADHRSMCKFSREEQQAYRPVWKAIKELVEKSSLSGEDIRPSEPALSDKEIKSCLNSLRTSNDSNPAHHKETRVAAAVPGTCRWFLNHTKYRDWLSTRDSSVLWVTGDPGVGKTVLSSFLIDSLKQTETEATVCYFFCDDKVEAQRNAEAILRGLLYQIFHKNHDLIRHAKPTIEFNPRWTTELSALWKVFKAVFDNHGSRKV